MNQIMQAFLKEAFESEHISHEVFISLWNTDKYQNQVAHVENKSKTCYKIYCDENYQRVSTMIENTEGIVHNKKKSQIKRKLSEMWSDLKTSTDPEDIEEMRRIKGLANKQKTKVKTPESRKRKTNPYFMFCEDHRNMVRDELPMSEGFTYQDVVKELGRKWKALNSSTQQEHIDLLEQYKQKAIQNKLDAQES